MVSRMYQKRGTAAEWASLNPVLDDGEAGVELDTGIVKFGDGVTAWNDLQMAWLPTGGGTLTGPLTVQAPTIAEHPARKSEVDAIEADRASTVNSLSARFLTSYFRAENDGSGGNFTVTAGTTLKITMNDLITQAGGWTLGPTHSSPLIPRDGVIFGQAFLSFEGAATTSNDQWRVMGRVTINDDYLQTIGRVEMGQHRHDPHMTIPFCARVNAGDEIVLQAYSLGQDITVQSSGDGGSRIYGILL